MYFIWYTKKFNKKSLKSIKYPVITTKLATVISYRDEIKENEEHPSFPRINTAKHFLT